MSSRLFHEPQPSELSSGRRQWSQRFSRSPSVRQRDRGSSVCGLLPQSSLQFENWWLDKTCWYLICLTNFQNKTRSDEGGRLYYGSKTPSAHCKPGSNSQRLIFSARFRDATFLPIFIWFSEVQNIPKISQRSFLTWNKARLKMPATGFYMNVSSYFNTLMPWLWPLESHSGSFSARAPEQRLYGNKIY